MPPGEEPERLSNLPLELIRELQPGERKLFALLAMLIENQKREILEEIRRFPIPLSFQVVDEGHKPDKVWQDWFEILPRLRRPKTNDVSYRDLLDEAYDR